tara:strand:+ start:34244 stop:34384 length:141 start_codon:yes stop_codon:yes gene_type:complete
MVDKYIYFVLSAYGFTAIILIGFYIILKAKLANLNKTLNERINNDK